MLKRTKFRDITFVALAVVVMTYVFYNLERMYQSSGAGRLFDSDFMPLVGGALSIGLLLFSWRRIAMQERETRKRIAAEQESRELAFQDPLTGLPNRRQFTEALAASFQSPPEEGASHALFLLDLNGFKQVNDVYGHNVGDEVLIAVGNRLMSALTEGEIVARLGGDEFAILARNLPSREAAAQVGQRIIDALAMPISYGTSLHSIGVGIGISLFPLPGADFQEVMRRADVAMYKAKDASFSAIRFFDDEMDRHVREREQLQRELRIAIAAKDVKPYFQPLVDLKTKRILGFEALARWEHKVLGDIRPERFISVAEETGLIHELSDHLLRAACMTALTWPDDITLAFNISPVQLKDVTVGLRILTILNQTGLRPSRLEIEITESALVRDLEAAKAILGSLRDAGVRIALDDFGTGYSSLYHLTNFKVDKIKIDRSFVERMGAERESAAVVSAMIGLGRGLGLTVIAEGVEGSDQQYGLIDKGCEQGQGYFFGKAVSAADTKELFRMPSKLVLLKA
jgi:diguanylate cyclase (GGDEF)-like protein